MSLKIFIYIIINILFLFLAFASGLFFSRRGRMAANASIVAGAMLLAFQLYVYYYPEVEYALFWFADYAYFRWWGICGAFLIIGARFDGLKIKSEMLPKLFLVMAFLVMVFAWRLTIFSANNDFDEAGYFKGVFLQSTGYTCAPCSCALLLRTLGVKTTEKEMAALCLTQERGTEHINIPRGLRLKLDPEIYEVRLTREKWEGLKNIPTPFIANIFIPEILLHTVAVTGVGTDEIYFADSLSGKKRRYKKDEFLKAWDEIVVYVIRKR